MANGKGCPVCYHCGHHKFVSHRDDPRVTPSRKQAPHCSKYDVILPTPPPPCSNRICLDYLPPKSGNGSMTSTEELFQWFKTNNARAGVLYGFFYNDTWMKELLELTPSDL